MRRRSHRGPIIYASVGDLWTSALRFSCSLFRAAGIHCDGRGGLPVVSCITLEVLRMGVSPETSSQNRDLGGFRLRRLIIKMSVSLETSSQNSDVEIAGLIFGSSKMGLSPETSSKKLDVENEYLRHRVAKNERFA